MKFFEKLRPFDLIIIGIIIVALIVGLLTVTGKRKTASKQSDTEIEVQIEAMFKNVVLTSGNVIFQQGDETFITIRNVPYKKLKITDVNYDRKKVAIPSGNSYRIIDDVNSPFQFDFLVTVVDNAKITKDGEAVVGGNKIKIGLPVIFEGKDYRLSGVISNITLPDKEEE